MAGPSEHNNAPASGTKAAKTPASATEAQTVERAARQRKRSIAIAVSLALLCVLFYVATIVKMGGGIAEKAGS